MPKPTFSLTIPSIHDSTPLKCRIFLPKSFSVSTTPSGSPISIDSSSSSQSSQLEPSHASTKESQEASDQPNVSLKAAIIAHPYASLGGSYDDPVVGFVAKELLSHGFVVGTFNFRGAQGSKGRTSWTAKPEQADYISFVGFMTSYLLSLSDSTSAEHKGHATSTNHGGIDLILGGYSYGSLIVTRLPPMQDILRSFQDPAPDTAMSDVVQKASQLAVETRSRVSNTSNGRSGSTIASTKAEHSNRVSRSPVVYGENKGRRKSRESDRESVEGLANPSTDVPQPDHRSSCPKPVQEDNEHLRQFRVQYLLISPLLPPVSFLLSPSLGSQFGGFGRSTELVSDATLTSHPTLAVFGSDDLFTSASKLQAWAKEMQMSSKGIFEWLEVDGAGHFWREHGVEDEMRERVARWASR